MHSTLELIIRNLYLWLLPNSSRDNLNKIPFVGHEANQRPRGILLGDLKEFEGIFIENIIFNSIDNYVNTMNLNNSTQLSNSFEMVGIPTDSVRKYYSQLNGLMKRRHQIVHQMDRTNELDPLHYPVTDISLEAVVNWQVALNSFFSDLLTLLPKPD